MHLLSLAGETLFVRRVGFCAAQLRLRLTVDSIPCMSVRFPHAYSGLPSRHPPLSHQSTELPVGSPRKR